MSRRKIIFLILAFILFVVSCVKNTPVSPTAPSGPGFDSPVPSVTFTCTVSADYSEPVTSTITATCTIKQSETETPSNTITFTNTNTFTITPTVTIRNTPTADELGVMSADRTVFIPGETGITVEMIYTASQNWNSSTGYGVVEIGLPPDFSPFSVNPLDPGYTTIQADKPVQNVSFCCGDNMRIYIKVASMNAGDKIFIKYGDRTGGGPGAVAAGYELTGIFECLVATDGDYTYPTADSPQCIVKHPTATATKTFELTNTLTATNTATQTATYTCTITETITITATRTLTATRTPTATDTITPTYTATPENKYFGGSGYDSFNSVCTDASGNIFAAGYTTSYGAGAGDILLVKYDSEGNLQWYKTFGSAEKQEVGNCIKPVSSGGFVIAGYVNNTALGTGFDFYLVRTDADGNLLWEKTYANTTKTASHDTAYSVVEDSYGGFVVAGEAATGINYNDNSIYAVKTDALGNYIGYFSYDTSGSDICRGVVQETQYNFYFAGGSMNGAYRDMMMIDASPQYNTWQNRWFYTASSSSTDTAYSIIKTSSGGYLLAGSSDNDFYVVNAASNGALIAARTDGYASETEIFYSAAETSDGYVCVGYGGALGRPDDDIYYVKYSKILSNPYMWEGYIGGTGQDIGRCVVPVNGGVIIVGSTSSYGDGTTNGYITKLDSDGKRVW